MTIGSFTSSSSATSARNLWDGVRGVSGRGAQRRGPRGATFRGETAIDDRANATSSQNAENSRVTPRADCRQAGRRCWRGLKSAVQPGEDLPRPGLRTRLLDRRRARRRLAAAKRSIQRAHGRKADDVSTQPVRDSRAEPRRAWALSLSSSTNWRSGIAVGYSASRLTSIRFGPNAVALQRASPHAVEIGPADLAER